MATLKRLEKRMNDVETWVKDFNKGSGPAQTMDNLNWLVGQTRMLGDRLSEAEAAVGNMQQGMQANNQIVSDFMESKDMVRDWQMHIEELQKEAEENAVQESETESLDVQEQAEDGEEVGEGDA
jgi:hypothetical protein|tara:strand:- start:1654 stop:2025 length:372 start_codon:yes stop_codon:yes gene_type:complete